MNRKEYLKKWRKDNPDKVREHFQNWYKKNKDKMNEYNKDYYRKNVNRLSEYGKRYRKQYTLTASGIWTILKKRGNRVNNRKISKDDFVNWYNKQKRKCVYCDVNESDIVGTIFRKKIVNRLQIDRMDNKKPYQKGNLVLACPICNYSKGEYFNYKEMLEIGKVIKKIRSKRQLDIKPNIKL